MNRLFMHVTAVVSTTVTPARKPVAQLGALDLAALLSFHPICAYPVCTLLVTRFAN
jgi:hypothetical protein